MANLFLESIDLLASANDPLNYIEYDKINEEQKEFLRSDLWDLQFLEAPHAVYFPGNDLLRLRTTEVNPSFNAGLGEISAVIRQFKIRQTVISGQSDGTISVNYVDREDQAIRSFIHDWREKLWALKNRYTFRKEDTIGTIKLTQFNSSRKPIAEWKMYAVQLQDGDADAMNKAFNSDDPSNNGEFSVTYSFEHYEYEALNV
jgi:hypothetical protein